MGASERDSGKWMDTWCLPFHLSPTLPVGGGLLGLYSLSGSPVIKQLMEMVTMVPGQGGRFQSVCFPLTDLQAFFFYCNKVHIKFNILTSFLELSISLFNQSLVLFF